MNIKYYVFIFIALWGLSTFIGCMSEQKKEKPNEPHYEKVPENLKKNGMISSSTYQVWVTTIADNERQALINGEELAKNRALKLLRIEPFTRGGLSQWGANQLQNLVEKHGHVVKIVEESANNWTVIYHIQKIGLRDDLQKLR